MVYGADIACPDDVGFDVLASFLHHSGAKRANLRLHSCAHA